MANKGSFKAGQSGNPTGRAKRIPAFVARFRDLEPKALEFLALVIEGGSEEKPLALDVKDRLKAIEIVLAYSRGKPRQQLELSGPGGDAIPISVGAREVLSDPAVRAAIQQAVVTTTEKKR